MPSPFLAAISIFLFAFALRFLGLDWGLPNANQWYSFHPDESTRQIVGAVGSILGGENGWNPKFFNYPSLSIYATVFVYEILAILGQNSSAALGEFWPIVRDIIFAGRLFSVFTGALTASLVFLLARELGFRKGALFAGVLAALVPAHVQHSHFATVDIPATFFCALCLFLSVKFLNTNAQKWFWLAVFAAGLAAGTKYNMLVVLAAPLIALWLQNAKTPHKIGVSMASIGLAFLAFLVSTPYAILDFPSFWGDANGNGFYFEAFVHPKIGSGDLFTQTGNGWIYHATFNLPFAFGWILIFAALGGVVTSAKNRIWWPILAFGALCFVSLGFSQVRFMRYVLPLTPVLALLAASFVSFVLQKSRALGAGSAVTVGAATLAGAITVLGHFLAPDPRTRAAQILSDTPTIATIENPWFYTPPFRPNFSGAPVEGVVTIGTDTKKLRDLGEAVLVVSEFEIREKRRLNPAPTAEFLSEVERKFPQKTEFQSEVWALPGRNFVPHDYLYTHPKIWIYGD